MTLNKLIAAIEHRLNDNPCVGEEAYKEVQRDFVHSSWNSDGEMVIGFDTPEGVQEFIIAVRKK